MNSNTSKIKMAPTWGANVNFVLVCVCLDMLSVGMILPSLPIFLGDLTTSQADQAYWYGALVVAFAVTQFLFAPIIGGLSDFFGRRPVMLFSMLGMALNFIVTATSITLLGLFIGRVIGGLSAANMSVASAYVTDITEPDDRAKTFGRIGAAFSIGFIFGPALGGLLGDIDRQLPFFVAAGICVANALYGYIFVTESLPEDKRTPFSLKKANAFASLGRLATSQDTRLLFIAFGLQLTAQLISQTTFALYTNFRFGWSADEIGIALCAIGIGSTVMQVGLLGKLVKRFGEARLVLIGQFSGATTFFIYAIATQGWMIYVVIALNIMSFASSPALSAIVSKVNRAEGLGTLMGAMQSLRSLVLIVAPLLGVAILAAGSELPTSDWRNGAVYFICSIIQFSGMIIMWRYLRSMRNKIEPDS